MPLAPCLDTEIKYFCSCAAKRWDTDVFYTDNPEQWHLILTTCPPPAPSSAWSPSWLQSSCWLKCSFSNHGPLFCAQLQTPTFMQSYDWRNVFQMKNNLFHFLSLSQLLIPTLIPVLELWLILLFFFFLNHIILLSLSLPLLPLLFLVLLTAVDPHSSFQSPLLSSPLSSLPWFA